MGEFGWRRPRKAQEISLKRRAIRCHSWQALLSIKVQEKFVNFDGKIFENKTEKRNRGEVCLGIFLSM